MTDLNQIQLPASLVADIYKNHLIEEEGNQHHPQVEKKQKARKGAPAGIQYLGQNLKGVCLLVNYSNDVHLPDVQLNFLTSILQACKLHLGDVAIINCNRQPVSIASITQELSCKQLLVFGDAAERLGRVHFPVFTLQNEHDCQVLYAPSAESLNQPGAESKLLKSKLWNCLKEIFGV